MGLTAAVERVRAWLDPDRAALLKRTRHVRYYGRWMTLETYLDERQFAMVLEVQPPA